MPAACSVFFWLVLLGVVVAVGYGVVSLINLALPKRRRIGWWSIALAVPGCVAAVVIGFYLYQQRPAVVYHETFGEWPTPDVTIRTADRSVLGDSGEATLVFTADDATVRRLGSRLTGTATTLPASLWVSPAPRFGFSTEQERLEYDPASRTATYSWTGVD